MLISSFSQRKMHAALKGIYRALEKAIYERSFRRLLARREMGLDSSNGHSEDVSHLFIRLLVEVAQDQHHAIFGGQPLFEMVFLKHVFRNLFFVN